MPIAENIKSSVSYFAFKASEKYTLLGILAMVALLSWVAVFASARSSGVKIYFFDVGQGDAIFVEMPDGKQILIDGGRNDKVVEKLNKVMPFWDREIDMMIATHADADHITGLVPALLHYDFETIIWNGVEAETKVFQEWKEAADAEGAEIIVGKCCMRVTLSESAFFEILYPFSPPLEVGGGGGQDFSQIPPSLPFLGGGTTLSQNNYSLVIRFVHGNDSFLFAGDIERQVEHELVAQNFNLKSDILKVPHHGSKTSSSELFLKKVQPQIAVISVGRNNPYGHPYEAILQRLEKHDIGIRRTDKEGDIFYELH